MGTKASMGVRNPIEVPIATGLPSSPELRSCIEQLSALVSDEGAFEGGRSAQTARKICKLSCDVEDVIVDEGMLSDKGAAKAVGLITQAIAKFRSPNSPGVAKPLSNIRAREEKIRHLLNNRTITVNVLPR